MTPPKQRESDVVRGCLSALHTLGVLAWRNNTGVVMAAYKGKARPIRFGHVGSPDLIGVLRGGRFLGVECKAGRNKQTPDQAAFAEQVNAQGGLCVCVNDPATLIDIVRPNL